MGNGVSLIYRKLDHAQRDHCINNEWVDDGEWPNLIGRRHRNHLEAFGRERFLAKPKHKFITFEARAGLMPIISVRVECYACLLTFSSICAVHWNSVGMQNRSTSTISTLVFLRNSFGEMLCSVFLKMLKLLKLFELLKVVVVVVRDRLGENLPNHRQLPIQKSI